MKLVDIVKKFVEESASVYWTSQFKSCEDYPREPEVVEFECDIEKFDPNFPADPNGLYFPSSTRDTVHKAMSSMNGRKWKARFEEIL